MTRRVLLGSWFGTILLIVSVAGLNWVEVLLLPATGGQAIEVTGFIAFPIIGALALLQGASLLVSMFTPVLVSKLIAAFQIPIIGWHLYAVIAGAAEAMQQAVAAEITKATGVVGVASQSQLIELALDTNLWYVYVGVLALNLSVLVALIFARNNSSHKSSQTTEDSHAGDLWDSQL
jgi:hypothetical protein